MMHCKSLYALVAGVFALFAQATPACAETIESAIESSLLYHPSIESAKANSEAAGEDVISGISGYFPELSVSGAGGRIYGDNTTSRGLNTVRDSGYSQLWEGSITASQMLFDGLETPSRIHSASARVRASNMDLLDVKEALALRAAEAYINVMRAQTGLSMLKAQKKKVADYLARIKNSVDEGVSDESEHQQARDVKVILDSFITDYEGQVRAAEAGYIEVTGHFPKGELVMPTPDINFIPQSVGDAITVAEENHPTLRSAMFGSEAAAYDIAIEKAQVLPDVSGELSYAKTDKNDSIGGESVDAKAVVRLNWNFEVGGGQVARIRRKKHEHQEAIARVREAKRLIGQGVRVAYSELQTSQGQLKNQQMRKDLNTKLFETYMAQFEGARINLLQLMQADNQLFNTKLERMSGEYRVLSAQYAVLASMGRLQDSLTAPIEETGIAAGDAVVNDVINIEPAAGKSADIETQKKKTLARIMGLKHLRLSLN